MYRINYLFTTNLLIQRIQCSFDQVISYYPYKIGSIQGKRDQFISYFFCNSLFFVGKKRKQLKKYDKNVSVGHSIGGTGSFPNASFLVLCRNFFSAKSNDMIFEILGSSVQISNV